MRAIALILLSALSCFGQAFTFNDLAFVCLTNPPPAASSLNDVTNLAGYPCLAFYLPSSAGSVSSNGTTGETLTDLMGSYNLANGNNYSSAKLPLTNCYLNGKAALMYTSYKCYLTNSSFSITQPIEAVMVISNWGDASLTRYLFNDMVSGSVAQILNGSDNTMKLVGVNTLAAYTIPTNEIVIIDAIFNGTGTASAIYTNNVLMKAGSTGIGNSMSGLTLGGKYQLGGGGISAALGAAAFYGNAAGTGAIPGTNTTARTAVYNALKGYFGL